MASSAELTFSYTMLLLLSGVYLRKYPSLANILLIEDDEALRVVIATTLRDAGHAVR